MKNIKIWIIFILLISILLIVRYFSNSNGEYQKSIADLQLDNKQLIELNQRIDIQLDSLRIEYSRLQRQDSVLAISIKRRDMQISDALLSAKKSKRELEKIQGSMLETRKKIEELKAKPANRTGDDLLNSLRLKIQL